MSNKFLIAVVIESFILLTVLTISSSDYVIPRPKVKVLNYTFPIEEGRFLVYEIHQSQVVLREYPAFYFEGKNFALGTPIRDIQNRVVGNIIGQNWDYYPITHRTSFQEKLYCGYYELEQLDYRKKLFYRNTEYNSTSSLREAVRIPQEGPFENLCFVYKMFTYYLNYKE